MQSKKKVAFWDSVLASQKVEIGSDVRETWDLVSARYDQWSPSQAVTTPIPKIIHQIWLGSPLPKLYGGWAQTWKRNHPDWEYRLWTEKELAEFGLENQESFDRSPNYGVKSDIARYEILHRLGGVYADTDFECLGSFETLCASTEFFAGIMYGNSVPINNGLIGSVPVHPILRAIMDDLRRPFTGHDGMEVLAYSGPIRFSDRSIEFLGTHPEASAVILPTTYFYAFPNRSLESKQIAKARSFARPESLAIHYWEVSWKKDPWTTRLYWWMKRHLPARLVALVYRLLKGKAPAE